MENAADALKLAFTIFIFVVAIGIAFTLISKAKTTSDTVLYYSDETNFYAYAEGAVGNREVSVTEIIPTLYRYYEESIGVTIKLKNGDTYIFDLNNAESNMLDTELDSKAKREENLGIFIEEKLLELNDATFVEEFVDIPISGIYEYGLDDSELTIASGAKKIYITYIQQ